MKRRLKQLFKISLALVVLVVIVAAFWSWRSFAAVEAALKTIRDRGEPASIADLKPSPVADDENAATFLTPMAQEIQQVVNEAYPTALAEDFSWRTGLTSDQIAEMQTLFDAHPDLPGQLAKASDCNTLIWPLDYDLTPSDLMKQMLQSNVRSIARFQVCRVRYLAATEKPEEATAVCLEELRLIRMQANAPLLISWMVNIACRNQILSQLNGILQTKTMPPDAHSAIEQELWQSDLARHFTEMLKTERAFGIESIRAFPNMVWPLTSQLENYLEYMNEQIDIGSIMPFESSPGTKVTPIGMTELLAPSLASARNAANRTLATERCLRILNAIQSRPDQETPVELTALGLPADAIIDPYSGHSLQAKSTGDGWVVYSVGENGNDDGGEIEQGSESNQSLDIGIGPPETDQ